MAHSTLTKNALDADASRLIAYLHRGGTKSYYTTFDEADNAHSAWHDSGAEPPAVPAGTNVYFGVNPCTAIPSTNKAGKPTEPEYVRARVEYVAALNCLYAEFDAKDLGGSLDETLAHVRSLAVQPSVIVDSGGGYHCYWLFVEPFILDTKEARDKAVDVQARWVTCVRGDKAAKDLPRVLRVPGTLNYKYTPPRPVAFVEADYSRLYTLDELHATLPANAPRTARKAKQNAPACHTDGLEADTAQPADFGELATAVIAAAAAMTRLSTERRDEYAGWLNVGMALRELGTIGYELWHAWSVASPKYNVGECRKKWRTFHAATCDKDIPLDALYRWADIDSAGAEPVAGSTLDDNERRQLQAYKARDVQTQAILNMDAPLAAKAVIVGMLPAVDAAHVLVANKDGHSGSVSVNYGNFADIMRTSKTTVARAVDIGDKAGLWKKDAEHVETKAGYDVLAMRLDLQPAFYNPKLAQPIEQKPRGGARPNAGRKPKCADCPAGTHVVKVTTVTYVCEGCGQPLDAEPTRRDVLPLDEAPAAAEFKHETGMPSLAVSTNAEPVEAPLVEANELDGYVPPDGGMPGIPAWLKQDFDMPRGIRQMAQHAAYVAEDKGQLAYKQAIVLLHYGEHDKALELAPSILDEQARANVLYQANEQAERIQDETGEATHVYTVSSLKTPPAVDDMLADTYDMVTAIRLADTYAPVEAGERTAYKTGLVLLQRGKHDEAAALAPKVLDARARAALLHLAARTPQATAAAASWQRE